jgi:hypothetical protein
MTEEEMNEYLKSIGGSENGYYSDRPNIINHYFFNVNFGWHSLIKELIDDLNT